MKLDALTPDLVRRAVDIYIRLAWPSDQRGRPHFDLDRLAGVATVDELFELFEQPPERERSGCSRFALRLGNNRYPFMKLLLQEYLLADEYFFAVDTHDDLDIRPENPDYEGWQEIKQYNRELALRIEELWRQEGIPTHSDLQHLAEALARKEQRETGSQAGGEPRARLLVVDDDESVARSLEALFSARGYDVELAFDGRAVMERMARDPLPDLVVLDYAMPELDGEEVLRRLRQDERTRGVRLLLATASSIDLGRLRSACGLLRKPYPREVLFQMVQHMLQSPSPVTDPDRPGDSGSAPEA